MHHDTPGVGKEILVNVPMELEPQLSTTLAALAEKKARNSWVEGKANHRAKTWRKPNYTSTSTRPKRWLLFSNPAGKDAVIIYPIYHFSPITKRLVKYDTIFPGHSRSQLKIWWFQAALHVATFGVSVSNLEEAIWFGWRKGSIGSTVVFYDFLMAVSLD